MALHRVQTTRDGFHQMEHIWTRVYMSTFSLFCENIFVCETYGLTSHTTLGKWFPFNMGCYRPSIVEDIVMPTLSYSSHNKFTGDRVADMQFSQINFGC